VYGVIPARSPLGPLFVLVFVLWPVGPALAESAILDPVRDNTLYENPDGAFSNGAGDHLFAGANGRGERRRAVLAFDVGAAVPPGATITDVRLTLHMSRTITGEQTVAVHRARSAWGEGTSDAFGEEGSGDTSTPGDATWIHTYFETAFWMTAGGDFESAPSATLGVAGPGFYTWGSTPALVSDVQAWVDDPSSDFGWIVLGPEEPLSAKRFDSREIADPVLRPVLEIVYSVPGSVECDPSPKSWGYWHRQCIGLPPEAGGLRPGRAGRGPTIVPEPGFVEEILPCMDARLAELGLDTAACHAVGAAPAGDPCNRALRRLAASIANVCSGRLQDDCVVGPAAGPCTSETVGDRIDEAAEWIRSGRCREAVACVQAVGRGGGPTRATRRIDRQPRAHPTAP
jgi:hypothetical protein